MAGDTDEHNGPTLLSEATHRAETAFRSLAAVLDRYREQDERAASRGADGKRSQMELSVALADARFQDSRREFAVASRELLVVLERAAVNSTGGRARILQDALDRYRVVFELGPAEVTTLLLDDGLYEPARAAVETVVEGFMAGLTTLVMLHGKAPRLAGVGESESPVVWHGSGAEFAGAMKAVYDKFVDPNNEQVAPPSGVQRADFTWFLGRMAPLFVGRDGKPFAGREASFRSQGSSPSGATQKMMKDLTKAMELADRPPSSGDSE